MPEVVELDHRTVADPAVRDRAVRVLEEGDIVLLPKLPFELHAEEQTLLDPAVVQQPRRHGGRARVLMFFDESARKMLKSNVESDTRDAMEKMVARYADWAEDLVRTLVPRYGDFLQRGPCSFRPCPRTGRQGLHVDSFRLLPTQGRRVLRVFSNVNPDGEPRTWVLGQEKFEPFAQRFLASARRELPGSGAVMNLLGITRGRRTSYDHTMRELRRLPKHDRDYNRTAREVAFPSGSTWIVFTDGVLHGAVAGQHAFEQTFFMPVEGMHDPGRSPLRLLERMLDRPLV